MLLFPSRLYFSNSIIAFFLLLPFFSVEAKLLIQHIGSNDPVSEGWELVSSEGGAPPNTGEIEGGVEVTASGEHHYWRVNDAVSDIGGIQDYLFYTTESQLYRTEWRMEASVRVIDSIPVVGRDIPGNSIMVSDGVTLWALGLGVNRMGFIGAGDILYERFIDLNSDYAQIIMQFNPNGTGELDDTVDVFVNGDLVMANVGRSGLLTTSANQVLFGGAGQFGEGDAHYKLVSLDDGNQAPVAIAGTSLDVNNQIQLDASLSSDADGDALSYSWLVNAESTPRSGLVTPIGDLPPGRYTVVLTVSDGLLSTKDSMLLAIVEPVVVEEPVGLDLRIYIESVELIKEYIKNIEVVDSHDHHGKPFRHGNFKYQAKHHRKKHVIKLKKLSKELDNVIESLKLQRCEDVVERLQRLVKKLSLKYKKYHWLETTDVITINEQLDELMQDIAFACSQCREF